MKNILAEVLVCDHCILELSVLEGGLHCQNCGRSIPMQNGIPLFTTPPEGIHPSEKLVRGPNMGTSWRQANWRFLEKQVGALKDGALLLDVGAGRGDFADLLQSRNYLALDVYPYPEVDLVCDLTSTIPFRSESFDAILLMNVIEHVFDTQALLSSLTGILKSEGALIVAIPFMVKMHQVPIDYLRYTHFALEKIGKDHGLTIDLLEGLYDPVFFMGEGIGNLKWSVLPSMRGARHYVGRALLWGIQTLANSLGVVVGPAGTRDPSAERSLAPIGYHVVYRKS